MKILRKFVKSYAEGGVSLVFRRMARVINNPKVYLRDREFETTGISGLYKDVLFINGCYLNHPSRYRVDHQMEQLLYFNLSCDKVFVTNIKEDLIFRYRVFVFFRCTYTPELESFILEARKIKKLCIFDIDDLIYEKKYVSTIKHIDTMSNKERKDYFNHVDALRKMIELCDGVVTTTSILAKELEKLKCNVYVNRNVASSEMVFLSEQAHGKFRKNSDNIIRIGYLSGSITHNPDIKMIEDALVEVASANRNVVIVLVGLIEPPIKLASLGDQLVFKKFVNWKDLPELIAELDINIAPMENTLFNKAKSENKWVEAALVRVPTVASNIGAFSEVISHGKDGLLCDDLSDWKECLNMLIHDDDFRRTIGENAYKFVLVNYVTQGTGRGIKEYLQSQMNPLIVFVVPSLAKSGGMRVILKHISYLAEAGNDVLLYVDGACGTRFSAEGESIPALSVRGNMLRSGVDLMVATLWTTVAHVLTYPNVKRRAYFVQNYETDFYQFEDFDNKKSANATYQFNNLLEYKTISLWCHSWLKKTFDIDSKYVPNGIDAAEFFPTSRSIDLHNGIIHLLVEGNSEDEYKNVDESMRIVKHLKEKYGETINCHYLSYAGEPKDDYPVDSFYNNVPYNHVPAIYRYCDVLIKSSKVESFSYPPLEMMATGGYVILGANSGNAEYARHRSNCMLYEIGDLEQAVRYFDEILSDPRLRKTLSNKGVEAAKNRDWNKINQDIVRFWM